MYVAENLKALRKGKEWTQEEMSEAIGVSPQSISKWERGDTFPDITLLPALANLFKVSVDAIIGMDKINEEEAKTAVFKSGHEYLRQGDGKAASKVFSDALKTYPNDESLMCELALVLSLESDPAKLQQAASLCERVLSGNPTEKVRHTTCAAVCFVYFKLGEKDKALAAARNLPHLRESRENILAEFRDEPDVADINSYLRFIALGEEDNQDKVLVDFGMDMVVMFTSEYDLLERIKILRKEIGVDSSLKGQRKLPHIRVRDNIDLPPSRVRVCYYADLLLDKDFLNPDDAVEEVIMALSKIAKNI
ncbi:MAG: helix-turn-helix domain-containing protein [Oscillospiraceae bacterium]|nr:helix-turn-helix domain-containing protein [Oscillospiraceae bacterium]